MTKALRIDVHPRVIKLAEMIDMGHREFSELHVRDKELLVQSEVDITDLVPLEQLTRYKLKRELDSTDSKTKSAILRAKLALKQ